MKTVILALIGFTIGLVQSLANACNFPTETYVGTVEFKVNSNYQKLIDPDKKLNDTNAFKAMQKQLDAETKNMAVWADITDNEVTFSFSNSGRTDTFTLAKKGDDLYILEDSQHLMSQIDMNSPAGTCIGNKCHLISMLSLFGIGTELTHALIVFNQDEIVIYGGFIAGFSNIPSEFNGVSDMTVKLKRMKVRASTSINVK